MANGRGLRGTAADARISKSYLSELERGLKGDPSAEILSRVAETLGVPLAAIGSDEVGSK